MTLDPTTTTAPPVPTPPVAAPEAPPPVPATDDAPAPEAPKPGKPFSWRNEFAEVDKNGDGKLAKSELKLAGARQTDGNHDGTVEYREFRAAKVKANSFDGLDADKSGTLDAKELAKMQRFDDRQYGDGETVTREDFLKTRNSELHDNQDANLRQQFTTGLPDQTARKMQRFAGADGKLSADEYVAGHHELWRKWHDGRQDRLFDAAGGEHGKLDVTSKEGERYKSYDGDHDGVVTKAEFKQGYKADLHAVVDSRRLHGELSDKDLQARLGYGKDGFANPIEVPADKRDLYASREAWFISQYGTKYNTNEDVPGWDNANCGPTSLTMVATAFGKIDPSPAEADAAIERSRRLMGDGTSEYHGTSVEGVARGAEAYGLDAHIMSNVSQKVIEGELAKGRLPIINGNVIRPDGSYGGGHFYVVTKIENGKAYLNDPYSKTGPSVVPVERLMHSINSHFGQRIISIGTK